MHVLHDDGSMLLSLRFALGNTATYLQLQCHLLLLTVIYAEYYIYNSNIYRILQIPQIVKENEFLKLISLNYLKI